MMAQADLKQIFAMLIVLLLAVQAFIGLAGQRHYLAWRTEAGKRGWRFQPQPWWRRWRRHYRLAGTTAQGAVWELRREQQGGVFLFRWVTYDKPLPYGTLLLLPQARALAEPERRGLQRVLLGDGVWQTRFLLLATHQLLGERHMTLPVQGMLADWPLWPQAGALEEVRWEGGMLVINGRFDRNWATIDRIVALGTALLGGVVVEE